MDLNNKCNYTVAIIDDEENIRETVVYALKQEGYNTLSFPDGLSAWNDFKEKLPHLAILDILMPKMDGIELCRRIRKISESIPIIFLTSRDEEFDRVLGLTIGGDDYLCKPFSMRELMARIKVLFRRFTFLSCPQEERDILKKNILSIGSLHLDTHCYTAKWKDSPLPLTVTEFMLLHALIRNPGHVKTRDNLMGEAYSHNTFVSNRTIDSHIKRLRNKFLSVDPEFSAIETVYGLGYRFCIDSSCDTHYDCDSSCPD